MKELYKKYKNIILVIVITVAVFFVYSTFFAGDSQPGSFLEAEDVEGGEALVGKELLTTLLELRSLRLDESLFSDRAFVILRDFSQEVQPQAIGRPNPFNEIGVDTVDPSQGDAPQGDTGDTEEGGES